MVAYLNVVVENFITIGVDDFVLFRRKTDIMWFVSLIT